MKPNRFDVHAHYMPPGTVPRAAPGQNFVSSPMPVWSPELALDFMDSTTSLRNAVPADAAHRDPAHSINEYGATGVKQYPAVWPAGIIAHG